MNLNQVIISAVSTEKSVANQEKNQHTFLVHPDATKIDIKRAMEEFWGIKVKSVQIIKLPKKYRVMGKRGKQVKRLPRVKAVVCLKAGEKFELLKFAGSKTKKKDDKKNKDKVEKKEVTTEK